MVEPLGSFLLSSLIPKRCNTVDDSLVSRELKDLIALQEDLGSIPSCTNIIFAFLKDLAASRVLCGSDSAQRFTPRVQPSGICAPTMVDDAEHERTIYSGDLGQELRKSQSLV